MRYLLGLVTVVGLAACSSTSSTEAGSPAPAASADPSSPGPLAESPAGTSSVSPDAQAPAPTSQCQTPLAGRAQLPADDTVHAKEPMEWWYWTGHLKTAEGRWFGFEEVFFRVKVLGAPGHMVHSAITDIDGNKFHHFSQTLPGELAVKPNGFDFDNSNHTAKGGNGHDALVAKGDGYAFNLLLDAKKRPTLQHGDGYTDYSFGGYTYYYSRERMDVSGTLSLAGDVMPVTGTGWFDHQYGDITSAVNAGWDWFAFQLDDNREMMLFVVRYHGKQVLVGASVTDGDCVTTEVPPEDVEVSSLGSWKSPHTTCEYPAGWSVKVKGESFVIQPFVADQEVYTSTPIYWEGASSITGAGGKTLGRAYVELNGYCPPTP